MNMGMEHNPASEHTAAANSAAAISFDDPGDFERASRGLVAQLDPPIVTMKNGRVIFDAANHAFIQESEQAPDSVHPGLWRQARLNGIHGLFEVADGVWQVRGYDIAHITFMAGTDGGWLVIDPLTNATTAAAALDLANYTLGERPVTSVIYTHSHVDHFGGILGVTSQEAVDKGDVRIVAPVGFVEEIVSEFAIAGHIMRRRAGFRFGPTLEPGPFEHVDCGLGIQRAMAPSNLLPPTETISETGEELTLSGIRIVFQNTPDAEAPAEMNFHFPEKRLLCMAENCTHTMHQLYPIRGAQTRNALAWSKYIHEAIELWADSTDTMFASHHWPRFGKEDVHGFLTMQRDLYRWIHDQTMRHANEGRVATEIAEDLRLPAEFDQSHSRGYYGSVSQNAKSVYNRYLGWYDANPANLNPLPPVEAGTNYVEFMGGADAVLKKARSSYADGEYRWVAQVVNHVVFADPTNTAARELQADALEQLAYQSEAATWRNAYLMGARELREGTPSGGQIVFQDMSHAMQMNHLIDIFGVRFDPEAFTSGPLTINLHLTDLGEDHVLGVGRSAVYHTAHAVDDDAIATLHLDRATFSAAMHGSVDALDRAEIMGDHATVRELFASLTIFGTAAIIEP